MDLAGLSTLVSCNWNAAWGVVPHPIVEFWEMSSDWRLSDALSQRIPPLSHCWCVEVGVEPPAASVDAGPSVIAHD